ncbi:MAG TPA: hypothetical protein VL728_06985 [Cyclobacteriaceae bacterium]|jgi:hypothetical protein|nr:hypothetical protein [Cyclobacteriaceae bacterium]
MKKFPGFVLFLCSINSFCQKAEVAFRIPEKDLIPEGISYDATTRSFFVSSINRRKIVKVDEQRKVTDFVSSGQDGIGEVLGLKIANGKLWACSNLPDQEPTVSMVHQYDIATGKLVKKCVLPPPKEHHLFNDMALASNGDVFISDSDFGAVYHVNAQLETPELWKRDDRLRDINGIAILDDKELVVNASIGFFKIDLQNKEISVLRFPGYWPLGIDGLSVYKQTLVGIQNVIFPVSVNQYYLNASKNEIENARVLVASQVEKASVLGVTPNPIELTQPTTGTVVDNWFYFVGNSQLVNYEKGHVKDPSKLQEVLVMRVKLD